MNPKQQIAKLRAQIEEIRREEEDLFKIDENW